MTPLSLNEADLTAFVEDAIDDDRMTGGEFRMVREFLGLTVEWLANHFNVQPRQVRRWEYDERVIPEGIREDMEDLEERTSTWVELVADKLKDMPDLTAATVLVYRNDDEFHAAHPEIEFPARWHAHAVARITLKVPGLRVGYAPKSEENAQVGSV